MSIKRKKIALAHIHNQNPSTPVRRKADDDDFRLPCLLSSSSECEEQARGGRDNGRECLDGDTDSRAPEGGDGEKLNLGAGVMMPLRLGDLAICFPATAAGSCKGNRQECFISCMLLRRSTIVLIVGLSDGSF